MVSTSHASADISAETPTVSAQLASQEDLSAQSAVHLPHPVPQEYDIAIVGSGIVGLTLACALKQSGMRVALVEAKPREAGLSQRRAYALTLMTGNIYRGLGIWEQILPQITTFEEIRLADALCPAVVNLLPDDLGTKALGYVGEHYVLVQALLDALADAETLTWFCPAALLKAEYGETDVTLTVSMAQDSIAQDLLSSKPQPIEFTIKTRLLVAADGSRSPLRQQAGIQTKGWQYWQSCVTAVIRPEQSHQNVAREHFWESGPFASLPLPGNRYQIVLTAPHAEAKYWAEVSEAEFLAELDRRYQGQLGKLELLGDRLLFPVKLMQSDRYIQHRLALVGDAAHCCHPVGGQGLNLGIRDAAALAEVIKVAHQNGEDIGSTSVLNRYQRWRKLENLTILGFTDLLDRSFSNRWLPIVFARRVGLRFMRRVRLAKFLALKLMTGMSGRTPELAKR
jgi:2-octaprenyl-6-methoxyphenol hydroxylase